MPNGLSVRSLQRWISFQSSSADGEWWAVMKPRAPALATAATRGA